MSIRAKLRRNALFGRTRAAALLAGVIIACGASATAQGLTIAGFGGSIAKMHKAAVFDPFTAETGIAVVQDQWGGEIAKIRAQAESGAVTWGILQVEGAELQVSCAASIQRLAARKVTISTAWNGRPFLANKNDGRNFVIAWGAGEIVVMDIVRLCLRDEDSGRARCRVPPFQLELQNFDQVLGQKSGCPASVNDLAFLQLVEVIARDDSDSQLGKALLDSVV